MKPTKQQIIDHLRSESGGYIVVGHWTFYAHYMICDSHCDEFECCYNSYSSVEETADDVLYYAGDDIEIEFMEI